MKHLRSRSIGFDLARSSARKASILTIAACLLAMTSMDAHSRAVAPPAKTQTRTTTFEYDPATGLPLKMILEPANGQVRFEAAFVPDAWGNRTTTTISSPATGLAAVVPRTLTKIYDARGQFAIGAVNAMGQADSATYDPKFGVVTSSTSLNAITVQLQYDGLGRKILEIGADGNRLKWDYLYCGGSVSCPSFAKYVVVTTPMNSIGAANGAWYKRYVDELEREVGTETLGFDGVTVIKTTTTYDASGRLYQASRPYFSSQTPVWDTYAYDSLDRVVSITRPDGSSTKFTYNGLLSETRNGLNQPRTILIDALGRDASITDAKNGIVRFEYDAFSNVYKITDAANNTVLMAYDIRGNKIELNDPDLGTVKFDYDAFAQAVKQTDAKSQVVSVTYDKLGRQTNRGEADLNSIWTYDTCSKGVGKLCNEQADNGFVRSYSYDSLGRATATSTTIDAQYTEGVSYDADGRVATRSFPNGFATRYVYSPNGALKEIRNNATNSLYWRGDGRDANGELLQQTFGNNVITQQVFSPLTGRIQAIYSGAGNGVQNLSYQFDVAGNLERRSDANQNLAETFLYDSLRRLTSSTVNSGGAGIVTQTYDYNGIGNIVSRSDVGTYAYGGLNNKPHTLVNIGLVGGGSRTFQYDSNSNLIVEAQLDAANNVIASKSRGTTYTAFNMPKTMTSATASATFTYDPEHQRVKQVATIGTTIYVHPNASNGLGYEKLIKPDASVEHKYFIEADDQLVAIVTQTGAGLTPIYVHEDALGSVTTMTNDAGAVLERFSYEPFGKRRNVVGSLDPNGLIKGGTTNRGFTEHEHLDSFGLIHMNGRVYDPTIGRFMSADPNVPHTEDGQSYNRFSYARNSPLSFVDPSGFEDMQRVFISGPMVDRDFESKWAYFVPTGNTDTQDKYIQGSVAYGASSVTGNQVVQIAKKLNYMRLDIRNVPNKGQMMMRAILTGEVLNLGMKDVGVPLVARRAVMAVLPNRVFRMAVGALANEQNTDEEAEEEKEEEAKTGDKVKDVTKRPSRVRKGTEQSNWDNAEDGKNGGKKCPTCDNEVESKPGTKNKDWDNDHTTPWRYRELEGKDRKGVLDEYNRDTRLRCINCNRGDNGK